MTILRVVQSLLLPAFPKVIVDRRNTKEAHVPRLPGSTAALCTALLVSGNPMMGKDDLMHRAEEMKIRGKEKSMFQARNQYDGWSGMNKNLVNNTFGGALVNKKNNKFQLTETGVILAKALHTHAHLLGLCDCRHPHRPCDSSDNFLSVVGDTPFTMCKEGRFIDLKRWAKTETGQRFNFKTNLDKYGLDCLYYVCRFGGEILNNIDQAVEMCLFVKGK